MKASSLRHSIAGSGLLVLFVIGGATLMMLTIWICFVSGMILVLRPALGLGGALLTAAGVLFALCLLVLAFWSMSKPAPPAQTLGIKAEMASIALRILQTRKGKQLALGSAGVLFLAAALMMPVPNEK